MTFCVVEVLHCGCFLWNGKRNYLLVYAVDDVALLIHTVLITSTMRKNRTHPLHAFVNVVNRDVMNHFLAFTVCPNTAVVWL
jgi:hypothetical protein